MIKIFSTVNLDVARPNEFALVHAKQGDINSRFITATVTVNGNMLIIPADAEVKLNVIRSDGYGASFEGYVMDDGRVTVPLDRWISAVVGESKCSIEITHGNQVLTTMRFAVKTEESDDVNDTDSPDIIPTDPEYDAVVAMIDDYKSGRLGNADIFIRYSKNPDGEGFTVEWGAGKSYIGIATGIKAPTHKSGYKWCRFVGDIKYPVEIVQETGERDDAVMSQKAVSNAVAACRPVSTVLARPYNLVSGLLAVKDATTGEILPVAYPVVDYNDEVPATRQKGLMTWYGADRLHLTSYDGIFTFLAEREGENIRLTVYYGSEPTTVYSGKGYDISLGKEDAAGVMYFDITDENGAFKSSYTLDGMYKPTLYSRSTLPTGYKAQNVDMYRTTFADGSTHTFEIFTA